MGRKDLEEDFEGEERAVNDPVDSNKPEDLRILEAVLFASDELMTAARLKAILPGQPDARKIRTMVEKINMQLQKERHPFEVVEIGGGYQFRTIAFYHPWVRMLFKEKAVKKLSIQALECLAIIAYKQPLSKAEIEAIRGVVSDGAMKTLLEKRLVTISGRSDKPGKPLLYATTQVFLTYFGLNKIEDLPRIEEFEALAREKMDELSLEELAEPELVEAEEEAGDSAQEIPENTGGDSSLFEVEVDTENTAAGDAHGDAGDDTGKAQPMAKDIDATVRDMDLPQESDDSFEVHGGLTTAQLSDRTEIDLDLKHTDTSEKEDAAADEQPATPEVTTVIEVSVASEPEENQEKSEETEGDSSVPEATVAFEVSGPDGNGSRVISGNDIHDRVKQNDGDEHEEATVFDYRHTHASAESADGDAVFEVDESKKKVARFSEDDVEFLGGALMETKAINPEKLSGKKRKKSSVNDDGQEKPAEPPMESDEK